MEYFYTTEDDSSKFSITNPLLEDLGYYSPAFRRDGKLFTKLFHRIWRINIAPESKRGVEVLETRNRSINFNSFSSFRSFDRSFHSPNSTIADNFLDWPNFYSRHARKRKSFKEPSYYSRQEPKLFNQSSGKSSWAWRIIPRDFKKSDNKLGFYRPRSPRRSGGNYESRPSDWRAYSFEPHVISFRACYNIYIYICIRRKKGIGQIGFAGPEFETESFISRTIVNRLRPAWQIPSGSRA